MNNGVIKRFTR